MLNSNQYNQNTYNENLIFIDEISGDDIIFNGLGLLNKNISISKINDVNLPNIDFDTFTNPIIDGGGVINKSFSKKSYNIEGYLKSDSAEGLNKLIDLFKEKITKTEGFLDIKYNGFYRRTKATCITHDIFQKEHYNITVVPYSITLQSVSPFSWNIDLESKAFENIDGNSSELVLYYGTAPSKPKIIIEFLGNTDKFIYNMNSRQITIEDSFQTGDFLVLNTETMSVELNGVEIDYKGSFPFLNHGENNISFNVVGNININATINFYTYFL